MTNVKKPCEKDIQIKDPVGNNLGYKGTYLRMNS
jgi:hypothetical protein